MSQLLQAFILGNSAILTNVCVLPLYPGLLAYMSANADNPQTRRAGRWLGVLVLAGILSLMLVIGAALYWGQKSFGAILPTLLPVIYGGIILLGLFMLAGYNPFARLASVQTPILRNPYGAAYVYGLLLGPMTLPCTGPVVVSAFLLGAGNPGMLSSSLLYFLAFGLGFGWPLLLLPILAEPLQRRLTRWTTQHYRTLTRLSGGLLVAIGLLGIFTDLLPNL